MRSFQLAARLVVAEDRLETRSMSIDEQLVPAPVVELSTAERVAEQGIRVTVQQVGRGFEVVTAHVDPYAGGWSSIGRRLITTTVHRSTPLVNRRRGIGQPGSTPPRYPLQHRFGHRDFTSVRNRRIDRRPGVWSGHPDVLERRGGSGAILNIRWII